MLGTSIIEHRTTKESLYSPSRLIICNDSERWSNNGIDVPPSNTRWIFQQYPQLSDGSSNLAFTVTYDTGAPERTFQIHNNLALMLRYLDLDYWITPLKPTTAWNRNRIGRYLRRLRDDVILELVDIKEDVLRDPTFGTDVLREWAVRVHHEYGHSGTGRKAYQEYCAQYKCDPYQDDFIYFGENIMSDETTDATDGKTRLAQTL